MNTLMIFDESGNTVTESTSTDNPTQTPQETQQQAPTVQHTPAAPLDVSGLLNAINSIPEKIVSGLKEAGHTQQPPKETKTVEEKPVEEVKTTPGKQSANLSGREKFVKWWTE